MATFPRRWTPGRVKMRRILPDLDLQCKMADLPLPEMEFCFHPDRKWRVDYCWPQPEFRLAVEIEGGAWTRGRHTRGKGFVEDIEKYNAIQMDGYALLRFTPKQVQDGTAIAAIEIWFKKKGA